MILGTSHNGAYTYKREGNHVMQYRGEELVGFLCSYGAWERTYHQLLDG